MMTDIHVHLAALPAPGNGCLLSRRMRNSPFVRALARQQGLPLDEPERCNRMYLGKLERELGASASVGQAVLLGLDGSYDASGRLDEARTDLLISNDAVFEAVKGRPNLLPGVSINPARRDALNEARRCAERGAALVKVLPNSQGFDPADPRFVPFYRTLAELGLPILTHVGHEFTLKGRDQAFGQPGRWRAALDEGAVLIGAHGCSSGLFLFERHFDEMLSLARDYPRFFVDVSALTIPNRLGALLRLRRHPEIFARLIFGTDYPVPCLSYPALLAGLGAYHQARSANNPFDRQARVLESLGIVCGKNFMELCPSFR